MTRVCRRQVARAILELDQISFDVGTPENKPYVQKLLQVRSILFSQLSRAGWLFTSDYELKRARRVADVVIPEPEKPNKMVENIRKMMGYEVIKGKMRWLK